MRVAAPLINMRDGPSKESRVVSQALFGERVDLLKERGEWGLIQTPDHYTGWVQQKDLVNGPKEYRGDLEVSRLQAHLYGDNDTEYGPLLTLPFASQLHRIDSDDRWHQVLIPDGRRAFIQRGDVESEPFHFRSFVEKFLGIPYTWGGRSSFGFDCSGYVQFLYARLGLSLPRDAKEQVKMGEETTTLRLGDLIFWGHSETDIRHVGLFLEGERFIHTSVRENKPYLRFSFLTDLEWSGKGLYPSFALFIGEIFLPI